MIRVKLLILAVILLMAVSASAIKVIINTTDDVKDGWLWARATFTDNNYGAHTSINFGVHFTASANIFHEYMWFNFPTGSYDAIACTLYAYLNDDGGVADTGDVFHCTRPNAKDYVGDNNGTVADSAEMSWDLLFEGGSGTDTAWTTPGGDMEARILGSLELTASEQGSYKFWVIDSAYVDSILKETKANNGIIIVGRSTTPDTKKDFNSIDNASNKPYVILSYTVEGEAYIEADATGSPDNWSNIGGANKVASVTDFIDDNYITTSAATGKQRFTLGNPSGIDGGDQIDSVETFWWGRDNGSGNNRVQMHQYVGANSNDGANVSLTESFVGYTDVFTLAPDGGAWTLTDLNDLQIEAHCTAIGAFRSVDVAKIYLIVYFTEAGAPAEQTSYRRREERRR